jgi:PKD repeat protein
MKTATRVWRHLAPAALVAAAALMVTACSIDKTPAPALTGPSEFGLSVTMTASPDHLPRDGSSQAVVTLTALDAAGKPVAGQQFSLTGTGASVAVSQTTVTTGTDGRATVLVTAPPSTDANTTATILATPIGGNFDNAVARSVTIALTGAVTATPVASFTVSSTTPGQLDVVTFDASATTLAGQPCPESTCTYRFDFGDGTNATGMRVSKRFSSRGVFAVTLTVTAPSGTVGTSTKTLTVGAASALTPKITFSPTNPTPGQDVRFDGRGSTTPDGASIVDYQWDFGNGETGSGATPAATHYGSAQTFTVRLTIRDELGRTGTTTTPVTVVEP